MIWLALFLALFLSPLAEAATYYVCGSAASCNTGSSGWSTGHNTDNTCTEAQNKSTPKLTISGTGGGLSCLSAGDTLIIGSATYTERIINNVPSGTSWGTPTTVTAESGKTFTLRPPNETQDASNGFGRAIYLSGSQQYIVLSGIVIDGSDLAIQPGNGRFEVAGTASHIAFQNSEMKFVPSSCIRASADNDDIRIINNKIHDNAGNTAVGGGSTGAHGIYWSSHNGLIEGNEFWELTGHGIQLFSSGTAVIQNNIIRKNIIRDHLNGNGSILLDGGNAFNNEIYNNLIYNVRSGITSPGDNGNKIYNNTVFHTTNLECIRNSPVGAFLSGAAALIKNNIFFDCAGTGNTYTPSGNFTTDPLFVSSGTDNFRLQPGSEAKDTAATIALVTDDIEGNNRPQGTDYDYGAYELVQGGGDTTPPSVPTGLTATVISSDLIVWDWNDSTGTPSNYRLQCCAGPACSNFAEVATPTASTYTYTSLTPSTIYRCQVASEDVSSNVSDYSSAVDATTIQTHSEQVEGESMTLISPMTIGAEAGTFGGQYISPTTGTPSTSPVAEATAAITVPEAGHYYLWARINGPTDTSDALYAGIDASFDRFFPSGLGTYQWIRIETSNGSGVHAFALTNNHTLQVGHGEIGARLDALYLTSDSTDIPGLPGTDTTPPSIPQNCILESLYDAGDSTLTILVDCDDSTDAEGLLGYSIEGCEGENCSSFVEVGFTSLSFFYHEDLTENTWYCYRVRAYDLAQNPSGYSDTECIQTLVVPDFPGSPTGLSTTAAPTPTFPGAPTGLSTSALPVPTLPGAPTSPSNTADPTVTFPGAPTGLTSP